MTTTVEVENQEVAQPTVVTSSMVRELGFKKKESGKYQDKKGNTVLLKKNTGEWTVLNRGELECGKGTSVDDFNDAIKLARKRKKRYEDDLTGAQPMQFRSYII